MPAVGNGNGERRKEEEEEEGEVADRGGELEDPITIGKIVKYFSCEVRFFQHQVKSGGRG